MFLFWLYNHRFKGPLPGSFKYCFDCESSPSLLRDLPRSALAPGLDKINSQLMIIQ